MTKTKPLPFDCPFSLSKIERQSRFSSKMSLPHFQQQTLLA
ncbi:hypothetical protein [Flavobacterium sp. LC2016-12]|nr:hypothetical protein [Flavobacterium sp. LC2016-12]